MLALAAGCEPVFDVFAKGGLQPSRDAVNFAWVPLAMVGFEAIVARPPGLQGLQLSKGRAVDVDAPVGLAHKVLLKPVDRLHCQPAAATIRRSRRKACLI